MNTQLQTLMEQHSNQIADLRTVQGDTVSVFAAVSAEFAIGESEQSLSSVLDSLEKIIEFAEMQGVDIGGEHAYPLMRTLVNAYYAGQDIDLQDRALSLLARLLFRLSRQEIDRSTAEEIIRVIGLAQRGVSEESRNFQRFLQILLAVIDLLTTDAALIGRKNDLVRSLNRILRENRSQQIISDSLSALDLFCDYLAKGEREGLLQSMLAVIHTDQLEVFRRCLQVIVRFSGHRLESLEKQKDADEIPQAEHEVSAGEGMMLADEQAVGAVPDEIAQAIIDRLPRPEFSAEIVQRLDVLFVLIAPAESQQRSALMDMIARIVESDNYSQIETVLKAFRPLYPQLSRREQVSLAGGVAGLFNRGDLRYLDLAVSVLDVFVADLSATDQTPIVRGLIRSMQSPELPRLHTVLDLLPASYSGFAQVRRHEICDELTTLMSASSKEMIDRSMECSVAIRQQAIEAGETEIQSEVSEAIGQAITSVLHETNSFPMAEGLIEFVIENDYLYQLLDNCLKVLERFRAEQGRENRVFELLADVGGEMQGKPELHTSLPYAAKLLGSFAPTHLDPLLAKFESLLAVDFPPLTEEIQSQVGEMLTTYQSVSAIVKVVRFILQNVAIAIPTLIDAAATALCFKDLHEAGGEAFDLIIQLYDASAPASPARESIAVGLRDAAQNAATFQELERVGGAVIAAPELPQFRKEEVEKEVASRLVPMLRSVDYRNGATDILHRLCAQMTHTANVLLRNELMRLLGEVDLPFAAYTAMIDLVCTHQSLQVELPAACADKSVEYVSIPETTDEALNLISEIWDEAPEAFKLRFVGELRQVVATDSFVYTPERYALLMRLIGYVYDLTDHELRDRENIQLYYIKVLIRFSGITELEESLYSLVYRETGALSRVLLPKSRAALSVWFLLAPLTPHLIASRLKPFVDDWKLPPPTHQQVELQQISIVFDHLLAEAIAPMNQRALISRAFINAMGQLYIAESEEDEDEDVVELGEALLSTFKEYIAGISDAEKQAWKSACEQIWDKDSSRGTPDVDRIRSGRLRKLLRGQIKEIFSR